MKMPSFLTVGEGSADADRSRPRDGAGPEAFRLAELSVQYEDLLHQVWRCEREWQLDDRIAYACRSGRRR